MSDNSGFNFKIYTPVEADKLALELSRYPDVKFRSYLIDGLKYGFDTGINPLPDKSIVCKNLRSALSQPECAAYLISEELKKGYLISPFEIIPVKHYHINAIGIAEGKYSGKKRLIVDLSAPHEDPDNLSLNELIDKEELSLQYVSIDDAMNIINRLGIKSWMQI